jgi:hypothetical protein
MKLLFDQNLSPKLLNRLADLFPGSSHVQSVGLDRADDDQVWEHAQLKEFAVERVRHRDQGRRLQQPECPAGKPTEDHLASVGQLHNSASGGCLSCPFHRH